MARALLTAVLLGAAGTACANFHLWQISEIYSNADGTVQFIEFSTASGGQQFVHAHAITASQGASTHTFTLPTDLPSDSFNKKFLIATQGFAALNLVTPDYIVPNNFLLIPNGTVNWAGFDTVTYAALPNDGVHSIDHNGVSGINSPTNFAGATGVVPGPNPPRLANISTRGEVLTGNDVMIAGFIIGGSTAKTVVVNVAGPSLASFGITNPLANPTLTLVRSSDSSVIATNDDWQAQTNPTDVGAIQAAGFQPSNALEPAIIATLAPGAYTAIVQGAGGGTGVGLVGVFEVDHFEIPLINISTRMQVLTGNDVMIAGFIIQGSGPQTVVVTVAGPSLANFGITNPLANPTLTLVRSSDNSVIATNDDWQTQTVPSDVAAIQATGFQPSNPLEPAIIATLPPGAYTVIVQGVAGGTGVGLVGVFTTP